MKVCDKCGADMKIQFSGGVRSYECSNHACASILVIQDDTALSISDIATDMAIGGFYVNSNIRRKEQTQLRKIATGLHQLAVSNKYLSASERGNMKNAVDAIERLATATEKSKKVLKQREDAENKRVEERQVKAMTLLKSKYNPSGFSDTLKTGIAMAIARKRDSFRTDPYVVLRREMRRIDERGTGSRTAKDLIRWEIDNIYNDTLRDTVGSLAYAKEPIDELVGGFVIDIEQTIVKEAEAVKKLEEELKSFLVKYELVEASKPQ